MKVDSPLVTIVNVESAGGVTGLAELHRRHLRPISHNEGAAFVAAVGRDQLHYRPRRPPNFGERVPMAAT
jgi:hypothetical protein